MKEKNKKGSALILAILTITSILLMVLGLSRLIIPHIEQNRQSVDSQIANYAAKAGKEYFMQNVSSFADGHSITIDLDTNSNTCSGNSHRCFRIATITEPNPGNLNEYRVVIAMLNNSLPKINQGLFATMSRMLDDPTTGGTASVKVSDVIGTSGYYFTNPHPYAAYQSDNPKTSCNYWLKSMHDLLSNPSELLDFSLIYIPINTSFDLRPFFNNNTYPTTLADYLITGGHVFIDNAHGAQLTFPTQAEFNDPGSIYYNPALANVGFTWSITPPSSGGANDTNYTTNAPAYLNDGQSDYNIPPKTGAGSDTFPIFEFDGHQSIFKYVYKYAEKKMPTEYTADPEAATREVFRDIIDKLLKPTGTGQPIKNFYYIDPINSTQHPQKVGTSSGYTEMAPYGQTGRMNIAMQLFGSYIKGWIVIASSSPGTSVTAQGNTPIDGCNTNAVQNDNIIAPYMFIFGIANSASKLKSVKITGTYGGIQRTYKAVPEVVGNQLKIIWKEMS
ncbi:MAG: hypothetical protein Q7S37_05435 [bacterium]|nr:hypothetical protein [bacterium]